MPFGLKNAPQIYQRMIDNALYGFTRIPKSEDHGSMADVLEDREPVDPDNPSVLGRRSYIDDILIPANSRDQLCDRVEGLPEACDKWNLSISVVKSFWGMPKVEYLGHKVSHNGLEENPKDLLALTDLAFPRSLRAMQSFLGSLNYYSRFIEDYAIYASVLSTALQGRLGQWAALLSPWTQEITKCVKGKDEILGTLAASITPRSEVGKALISITPKKEPRRKIQVPIPTIRRDEELYVVSFDGSARVKRGGGAYSAILWKLPEWRVLKARSGYAEGLTVNEAEYHGLAGAALQRQCGIEIESDAEIQDLITLNRLDETLIVKAEEETVQVSAVTTRSKARSGVRTGSDPGSLREEVVRELRIERIRQAQDEESWIMGLKKSDRRDPTSETGRG
ncbi:reverse transcriptase [Phytophthora megakarya]|uniref:Reverse transcriptase n=1 Tax=Phytophthora megakarya TaxID=4795 RepID=A0A225UYN1_9STRA|nr:reverse transcriptase [Phytophthora megakarya]